LKKGDSLSHKFAKGRRGYLHLVDIPSELVVNDQVLKAGDGLFIIDEEELNIKCTSEEPAEFVLFDLE
jgi:hypothetical protein